jgi:cytochrome b involved in lipid metabolism
MESGKELFTVDEVAAHNSPNDCWLIVEGQVWDFSSFIHPGGSQSKADQFNS